MPKKTRGFVFMLGLVHYIYFFQKKGKKSEGRKEGKEREMFKEIFKMIARNIPSPSLGLPHLKRPP